MPEPDQPPRRQRGRPRGTDRSDVHTALLNAFRECLAERSHSEITLKEVAERAGSSQEMVRYYFGGKDGLITALLRQTSDQTAATLEALEGEIVSAGKDATRLLMKTLVGIYLEVRDVSRVSVAEFQKANSAIRSEFLVRRAETVISRIHLIIERLIDNGVYDSSVNARQMALSIMTMVSGPIALIPVLPDWISSDEISDGPWLDHLVDLVERRCLPDCNSSG